MRAGPGGLRRRDRCCTWRSSACSGRTDGALRAVVTMVYLHLVGFGAILLSGFWSVANEVFDPREAKRHSAGSRQRARSAASAAACWRSGAPRCSESNRCCVLLAVLHLAAGFALRGSVGRQAPVAAVRGTRANRGRPRAKRSGRRRFW